MWRRGFAVGAVVVALLLVAGVAIAAGTSSTSTETSTTETSTVTSIPEVTTTSMPEVTTTSMPGGMDGTTVHEAGAAGTVTVLREGDVLTVTEVNPNDGWTFEVEQATGREVEVKFLSGNTRVDFNAELEDGEVRVRVRTRLLDPDEAIGADDDGAAAGLDDGADQVDEADDDVIAASDLGTHVIEAGPVTVTIEVTEDGLMLLSVDAPQGFDETRIEQSSDEIELRFKSDSLEVRIEIELDHGRLDVDVEVKDDDDHGRHGHDDDGDGDDDNSGHGGDDEDDD